ncbi:MAG: RNA polymerase sigma factor [Lachnospiraceae bacterium]|nr:RNA polymerase sigma factor [Lachnospiraceae bacterium]
MNYTDLENFMEVYGQDILSFCKYLTRNKEEAEDLCQDALVKGYEMSQHIENAEHAKRFFLSVAVKLWKNRKRKYAWRSRIVDEQIIPKAQVDMEKAYDEDTPENLEIKKNEQDIVRSCVDSLSDKKRIVVLLYYTENLSEREIAEILGLPVGTVKSRLHQAKTELSHMLSKRL